jgi:hypothetical protein
VLYCKEYTTILDCFDFAKWLFVLGIEKQGNLLSFANPNERFPWWKASQ